MKIWRINNNVFFITEHVDKSNIQEVLNNMLSKLDQIKYIEVSSKINGSLRSLITSTYNSLDSSIRKNIELRFTI